MPPIKRHFPSPSMRHIVHIPFPCTTISIRCFLLLVREIPPPPLHPLPSASCSPTPPIHIKTAAPGPSRAARRAAAVPVGGLSCGRRPDFPGGGYRVAPRKPGELRRRAWREAGGTAPALLRMSGARPHHDFTAPPHTCPLYPRSIPLAKYALPDHFHPSASHSRPALPIPLLSTYCSLPLPICRSVSTYAEPEAEQQRWRLRGGWSSSPSTHIASVVAVATGRGGRAGFPNFHRQRMTAAPVNAAPSSMESECGDGGDRCYLLLDGEPAWAAVRLPLLLPPSAKERKPPPLCIQCHGPDAEPPEWP